MLLFKKKKNVIAKIILTRTKDKSLFLFFDWKFELLGYVYFYEGCQYFQYFMKGTICRSILCVCRGGGGVGCRVSAFDN